MNEWEKSLNADRTNQGEWVTSLHLNPSLEGRVLDKLKKTAKSIFGPNQTQRVDNMEKNLGRKFTISEVKKLSNKNLSKLCEKHSDDTTVPMSDIAIAYLSHVAFDKPMVFLSSIMCGNTYSDIVSQTKGYLVAVDQISNGNNQLTTRAQVVKQLGDIEKAIKLGNRANQYMQKVYDNTEQQSIKQINSNMTYLNAVAVLEHLMVDGGTVTKQSTNEYPGIMLDELIEHDIVTADDELLRQAKSLRSEFNTMYKYSTKVDEISDKVWKEWQTTQKLRVSIADIYLELTRMNPSNESSEHTMTVDSVMAEWGDVIKGWQDGVEYTPGNEDDDNKDMGEVSDGNHTFNELYEHRTTLFSIILNQNKDKGWKSKLHDDGTMFDNYFIAGITTPEGEYTYHQHMDWWDKFDVEERERAPEWDGHKPEDITRLYSLLK